jgi:CO/xanthine dehydrogenase Mo-binding subunit
MKDVGGGFEGLYKVLATGKVRFKGEAVALVAAETERRRKKRCRLIDVDYQCSRVCLIRKKRLKPDAYLVSSEDNSNQIIEMHIEKGDAEKAFAEADLIVENEYRAPAVDHVYLETESGVAGSTENGGNHHAGRNQVLEHYRTRSQNLRVTP